MSQAERQKGVRQSLLDAPSQNVPRALVRSVSAFSPLHLSKYFSNFPFVSLVPLSLSLSLLPLCYITLSFDRVINFQFNRDRSRVLGKDRLIPSGLQTSTNLVVKFSLFPRIVNKTRIVFRARVENIDTDDSCGE